MGKNKNKKKVLVTGAAGFIGSHLVEILVAAGYEVRAMVRYTARQEVGALRFVEKEIMRSVEIVQGDIKSYDAVARAMEGVGLVFHLGALISIPYSYVSPEDTIATNILGTLNVLRAAQAAGVDRVVHTSTSETYGTAQYVPMDEKHPLQGQSPYSASKIGADKLAESFFRSFGLPVVTLRPFNSFGPRQSTRAVIPTIITQYLRGKELHLGNLTPTRDYTYVRDTAAAFLKAADAPSEVLGREINIGSNREISIGDIVGLVGKILGKKMEVVQDSSRLRPEASEVDRLYSDSFLASELLGWKSTISFEDGLRQMIDWISDHLCFYRSEGYDQ